MEYPGTGHESAGNPADESGREKYVAGPQFERTVGAVTAHHHLIAVESDSLRTVPYRTSKHRRCPRPRRDSPEFVPARKEGLLIDEINHPAFGADN